MDNDIFSDACKKYTTLLSTFHGMFDKKSTTVIHIEPDKGKVIWGDACSLETTDPNLIMYIATLNADNDFEFKTIMFTFIMGMMNRSSVCCEFGNPTVLTEDDIKIEIRR